VARLCSTRLNRAMSAYSSACQSCGSICVVSGFHVSPSPSTNVRATSSQSVPGMATACAAYVPVAPLILPRYSARSTRASWRRSRAASTASSLPSVVGVAGWPWVRASIGTAAVARASSASASTSRAAAGNHTSRTAERTVRA